MYRSVVSYPTARWVQIFSLIFFFGSPMACVGFAQAPVPTPVGRAKTGLVVNGQYIDQRIAEFMMKKNIPGLAMAIVQAPYIPRSAGYGTASLVNDQLASTRTMWNIGPITQAYTAVAIFQLYEDGKLDIHDSVAKYLSGLPHAWDSITIFELLQHASGIPDYRANPQFDSQKVYSPEELVGLIRGEKLLFKTGDQVQMSASDFLLLGLIIQKASGMSYHDYVTHNQIERLGLHSTMFAEDIASHAYWDRPISDSLENQHTHFKSEVPYIDPVEPALGYQETPGGLTEIDVNASKSLFAFGSLWSSAEDVSIWDIGLAGSTLVHKAENRKAIYSPTRLRNGTVVPAMAGWEFTHHPGFMEIKGNSPGFSSYLSRFTDPKELVCVTLLVNREGVDLTDLARDIAEAYKTGLGVQAHNSYLVSQESKFEVGETVTRMKARLNEMHIPVFATFDHAENAREAGLNLRPTTVLVFGNAKVGTQLMYDNQAIAVDLPLHVSIWEDDRGQVWVSHESMEELASEYGLKNKKVVSALDHFLEDLVDRSVNVYAY